MLDDRWLVKSLLGKGSYGKVYHCTDLECPIDAALKVEPRNDQKPGIEMVVIRYSWTLEQQLLTAATFFRYLSSYSHSLFLGLCSRWCCILHCSNACPAEGGVTAERRGQCEVDQILLWL